VPKLVWLFNWITYAIELVEFNKTQLFSCDPSNFVIMNKITFMGSLLYPFLNLMHNEKERDFIMRLMIDFLIKIEFQNLAQM